MKYISIALKHLHNLKHLELNFYNNKLGLNLENMKYLAEGLKPLHNLELLYLFLAGNNLG